ncbi:MAG: endonuclease III [Polyangiaceae bacterium]|nr:endonuclease III [Polyangiaceae bacterium]
MASKKTSKTVAKKTGGGGSAPATPPRVDKTKISAADRDAAKKNALTTFAKLRAMHPDAHCELDHKDAFQLLVATVLSAQTTDVLVNKVTPHLFAKYPTAKKLADAEPQEVATLLGSNGLGMYNQKAKNIVGLARGIIEKHRGQVPKTLAELIELPGVGRKTANVVLGVAFGTPEGVVVDTHVQRISQRLGWTAHTEPPEIEADLCTLFPKKDWDMLSHTLIFQGRRVCAAMKPACASCGVSDLCPAAFHAEKIGRKDRRPRS